MKFADDHGMKLLQLQALIIYIRNFSHFCRSSSSNWGDWEFTKLFVVSVLFSTIWALISLTRKGREYCSGFSIWIGCFIERLSDPLFSLVYFSASPRNSPLVLAKCAKMPDKRTSDQVIILEHLPITRWEDWESNCFVFKIKRFFLSLKLIWSNVL